MFFEFLKITIRSIIKQRVYVAVNVLGLTISTVVFLLISLFIDDELRFDKYHENYENVYRVVNEYKRNGVGEESSSSPFPVIETLREENPGLIKEYVRFFNFWQPKVLISPTGLKV